MDNGSVNSIKPPSTYEQQIQILRNRGLTIEDEISAIDILKRINYYRLSAYMISLKSNDIFHSGVTFEDIYNLYEFDKKLRNLLMGILESIEISFRTHIAYHLSHKYGPLGYIDNGNFEVENYHNGFIDELKKELDRKKHFTSSHVKCFFGGESEIRTHGAFNSSHDFQKDNSNIG